MSDSLLSLKINAWTSRFKGRARSQDFRGGGVEGGMQDSDKWIIWSLKLKTDLTLLQEPNF